MRSIVPTLLLTACIAWAGATHAHAAPEDDAPAEAEAPAEASEEAPAEAPEEAPATPVTYTLTPRPDGSSLYVLVYNDPTGLASRFGHDHAISPTQYTGTVVWSADDPTACDVRIEFPVSSLAVDVDSMRAKAGLDPDGAVGDSAKETIKGNFLGRNQLDAKNHSTISYRSSKCEAQGDKVAVTGTLSIRGVGKQVTVPMSISADGSSFSASGRFTLEHTDFGFKPFTNLAGALRNKPELRFVVDVTGQAD